MKISLTHKTIFLAVVIIFVAGVAFSLPHTRAISGTNINTAPIQSTGLLIDSSFDGKIAAVESVKLSADAPQPVSDFGNTKFDGYNRELFLSPDRKLIAVTLNPIFEEADSRTYIATIDGKQLTEPHFGSFISWAPDSSKVLLYVSTMGAPWDRYIYAHDVQGEYYDLGLPNGTISADISPVDGSIAYSYTHGGTDASTIYLRDPQGKDKVLVGSDNTVLAWVRWSPKGDKISFMKSNLTIDGSDLSVWDMNPDGTGAEKISKIDWSYPAVWSPDGTRLAFSNAGDVLEYDAAAKSLRNTTNLAQGGAEHPSYSVDGKTITFSSNGQIWETENGKVAQLKNDGRQKDYPIIP